MLATGNGACTSGCDCRRCPVGGVDDDILLLPERFCNGINVREIATACTINKGRPFVSITSVLPWLPAMVHAPVVAIDQKMASK